MVYSLPKGGDTSTKELIQAELDALSDEDLEVLYALIKQFIQSKQQEAVAIIEQFLAAEEVEVVHLTPRLFTQGFKSHQDKAWGLVDCISFIVMSEAGVNQALTFWG